MPLLANRGGFGHLLGTESIQPVRDHAVLQALAAHSEHDTVQWIFLPNKGVSALDSVNQVQDSGACALPSHTPLCGFADWFCLTSSALG